MALRIFSSIATSTVLFTTSVAISSSGTVKILALQETANMHIASSVSNEFVQENFFPSVYSEALDRAKGEAIWKDIEPLFGLWADDEEIDDNWLHDLRSGWDTRLRNLYDFEADD